MSAESKEAVAGMLSVEEYTALVCEDVHPLAVESRELCEAYGMTLAEDIYARIPVPPWTNSAMDGFAVRACDTAGAAPDSPVLLEVDGNIPAGCGGVELPAGKAMRIMTGAQLPQGADAVIPCEDTDHLPGTRQCPQAVSLFRELQPGRHVRFQGENIQRCELVVEKGRRVNGVLAAAIVSVGYGEICVRPRPKVAILVTGAELQQAGEELKPGYVPDSNSYMLEGLLRDDDCELVGIEHYGDQGELVAAALEDIGVDADLIITCGGVSAGAYDPLKEAGRCRRSGLVLNFHRVAMQPGKPQGYGHNSQGTRIICLPGNPVSVLVSYLEIVRPFLAHLRGQDLERMRLTAYARASQGWTSPQGRAQFVPVVVNVGEDRALQVSPVHRLHSASHLVASAHEANALAVIPAHQEEVRAGDTVTIHWRNSYV